MKLDLDQSTIIIILVIILVVYYSTNALSSPEVAMKKVIYKNRQLGTNVGDHGGLLVSSPEINVRTRGPNMNFQQQGFLYKDDNTGGVLGLFGRQKYPGSNQWEYMVGDKSLDDVKIPLDNNKKELLDNDEISVKGFGNGYKVQLYENQEMNYLPF